MSQSTLASYDHGRSLHGSFDVAHKAGYEPLSAVTAQRLVESVPPNTRAAYEVVARDFDAWCARCGRGAMPAAEATLVEYVSHLIDLGRAPATISQHIGAIRKAHRVAGYLGQPDTERALQLLRGYRRKRAENGTTSRQASPILTDTLRAMVDVLDLDTLAGRRNQVLLVLGFAMMARRSELASLTLDDVIETPDGLEVAIRTSKTDRDALGAVVAVPAGSHPDLDPVRLVASWRAELGALGITVGPLLRAVTRHGRVGEGLRPRAVNRIVQRIAHRAGMDDRALSAHSLRAGGLTAALRAGVPIGVAARHGRWSEKSPVVNGYARAADRWRDNAMRGVL